MVEVEGAALRGRLVAPIDPPVLAADDVIAPTIVRIAVAGSGDVFSAIVRKESGSKLADQEALRLATRARFELPADLGNVSPETPDGGLVWGELRFLWSTSSAVKTNTQAQTAL